MTIVTVGIDLAKNVFAVHGVDEAGRPALVRPEVPRAKLLELIANVPPCAPALLAACGCWPSEMFIIRTGRRGDRLGAKPRIDIPADRRGLSPAVLRSPE